MSLVGWSRDYRHVHRASTKGLPPSILMIPGLFVKAGLPCDPAVVWGSAGFGYHGAHKKYTMELVMRFKQTARRLSSTLSLWTMATLF